ncbi:type III secretion system stator protein SctL [Caldimonas brevitalea]|uniref:type III secretion system stator protein SctL n=1 Tax=Caldimonas brevitalea TaxID=413882 RepID=UPI000AAC83D0|nr:type III secretion system stator protein SctL [Caldimonas brevitalea]
MRAAEFATLTTLLSAAQTVEAEHRRIVDQAQAEAQELLAQARAEAEALLEDARRQQQQAHQEGLERGWEDAAAQWAEQAVRAAASNRRSLERQTERLSQIVSLAVERVIEIEDRSALYRRAFRTVSKLLKDVPMLTLRVPADDQGSARSGIDAVLRELSAELPVEVVSDAALAPGSCLFESDQGVIDAGLDTQLAAIKRAVSRAAHQVALASLSEGEATDETTDAHDEAIDMPALHDDPAAPESQRHELLEAT